MTLEEFMRGQGYAYQERNPWDDSVTAGWKPLSETELQNMAITDFAGRPEDYADRAVQYYDRFGGDFAKLAQMAGYQGSNPAAFLMGVENVQGQPVPYGEWATQGNPLAGMNDSGFMPIGMNRQIQDWALPQLASMGITPQVYAGGAKQSGGGIGDMFANAVFGLGTGAIGGAAFGLGPLAGASNTLGSGGIFGPDAFWATGGTPTFAGGASGAGVTGATGGGELAGLDAAMGGTGGAASWGVNPAGWDVSNYINNGVLPNGTVTPTPTLPSGSGIPLGAGSTLGNILSGNASDSDWLEALGTAGSTALGLYGANQQANAFGDMANKYLDMGQPYRDKLLQSYQPGFSMADQPDFMNAMDIGAQAAARATSAKVGNPVDNPGAYAEMQKYISGSLALPQLNTYRSQLGSFGQLGTNTAGTAQMGQIQSEGGMYDALGYGLGKLTQPKNPYEDMMKGLMGGFKLNTGTSW